MNTVNPFDELCDTLQFLEEQKETGLFNNTLDSVDLYYHLQNLIEKSQNAVEYIKDLEEMLTQAKKHSNILQVKPYEDIK